MLDKDFWNERYGTDAYLYGTQANSFLQENVGLLSSPVLSLSEGEGRNAVFMASHGLKVVGVDCSEVGLEKAQALARSRGVVIETRVADLAEFHPEENHYGAVVSISAHLLSDVRRKLYPRVEKALKPNGILLLEHYSEAQLARNTGGPKNIDALMTIAKLRKEFPGLTPIIAREIDREVREGEGHTGLASVVQYVARKET